MARYPDELERLRFSEAQKETLVRRLTAEQEPSARSGPRLSPRALVALVAAVSLLIGAAGAVSLAGLSPEFRRLFGITDEAQAQNLGALSVEKTFPDKNGTGAAITVREVVADQDRLYILMDFTAPAGTVLPEPERGEGLSAYGYWLGGERDEDIGVDLALDISLYADEGCTRRAVPDSGWGYHVEALTDPDPTDNVIPLLAVMTTDRGLPEQARYCRLDRISNLYATQGGTLKTVLEGMDIQVVTPIPTDTQTYSFGGRAPVKLGGATMAVVEDLTISPISLSMDLVIPDWDAYDAAFEAQGPWSVYVLLRDGTRVSARYEERYGKLDWFYTEPGEVDEAGGRFFRADHVGFQLERPIDVAEIEDIVFVGDNDPVEDRPNEVGRIVHFMFYPGYFYNKTYWNEVNENWKQTT